MRLRLLPALALAAIALTTSGCWMLFGLPGGGQFPTPAPVIATPIPVGDGMCGRAEYRYAPGSGQKMTEVLKSRVAEIEGKRLASFNLFGITQTPTPDGFVVVFPGFIGNDRIRDVVGRTGNLDFVAVPAAYADKVEQGAPLPRGMDATPLFSGDQIASIRPGTDSTGLPALDVTLKPEGTRIFDDFAATSYAGAGGGVKFAIVLDGIVESALGLNTDHFDGVAQIVGTFTNDEVSDLAAVLGSPPLPIDVDDLGLTRILCPANL